VLRAESSTVTGRDANRRYDLRCPHCGEQVHVDADVRELLLASGCVVCGGSLSVEAFGRGNATRGRDRPSEESSDQLDQQQNMNG